MKKQYTSMQQELAARRAAEASGAQGGQGEWHSRPTGGHGANTWRSKTAGNRRSNAAPRNLVGKRTQSGSPLRKSLQSMVEQISLGPTRRAKQAVEKSSAPFQRNSASSSTRREAFPVPPSANDFRSHSSRKARNNQPSAADAQAYTSVKSNRSSSTPEDLRVRISDVEELTDAEDLRVRISDVEDLSDVENLTTGAADKDKGHRKTSPAFFAFLAIFCLFFIGMIVDVAQDMGFDDDWEDHWAATTDYGIDEDSDDLAVQDYILDVTYAPDDDEVDQDALTKWLENADALLADVSDPLGIYDITLLDNRILINATFDPDVQDQHAVISYWEDAYYTIYDSLLEEDLEALPVCVVLRDSEALQLRGILIDGGTNYTYDGD